MSSHGGSGGDDDSNGRPTFDMSHSARKLLAKDDSRYNLNKGSVHSASTTMTPSTPLSAASTPKRKLTRHSAALADRLSVFEQNRSDHGSGNPSNDPRQAIGSAGASASTAAGSGSMPGGFNQRQHSLDFDALVTPRRRAARPSLMGRIQQFEQYDSTPGGLMLGSGSGHGSSFGMSGSSSTSISGGSFRSNSQKNLNNSGHGMIGSGSGHGSSKRNSGMNNDFQALLSPKDVKRILKANTKKRESIIKIVDQLESINKEERAKKDEQLQIQQLYAELSQKRKERKYQMSKSKKTLLGEQGRQTDSQNYNTRRSSSGGNSNGRRSSISLGNNDNATSSKVMQPWKEVRATSYDFSNFQPPVYTHPKTSEEIDLIRNVVNTNVIFSEIQYLTAATDDDNDNGNNDFNRSFHDNYESFSTLPVYDTLIQSFESVEYKSGDVILEQGQEKSSVEDCHMYIVQEGKVEFKVDGVTVGTAEKGQSFGEDALLYNSTAPVSVHVSSNNDDNNNNTEAATTTTKLLRLDQKTFRGIMYTHSKSIDEEKIHLLKSIDFLKDLIQEEPQLVHSLSRIMTLQGFTNGQTITATPDTTFYIVQDGTLHVTGDSVHVDFEMSFGDYLGEDALFKSNTSSNGSTKTTTLTLTGMKNGGIYYTIDRVTLEKCLGPNRLRRLRDKLHLVRIVFYSVWMDLPFAVACLAFRSVLLLASPAISNCNISRCFLLSPTNTNYSLCCVHKRRRFQK